MLWQFIPLIRRRSVANLFANGKVRESPVWIRASPRYASRNSGRCSRFPHAIHPGSHSVTHAFDEGQRLITLSFAQVSGGISVTLPASRNVAPPGPYLLFLVNGSGVPSVAR